MWRFNSNSRRLSAGDKSPVMSRHNRVGKSMKLEKASCFCVMLAIVFLLQFDGGASEKDGGFILYPSVSKAPGPVAFSHRLHGISGAGYACDQCHSSASTKALSVTMEDIRQGRVCGSCHNGKTKGPRSQLLAATIQDCSACHMPASDIIITLNRMDPVAFSHVRHLGVDQKKKISNPNGFSCSDCHPAPFERDSKESVGMKVPHENGGCAHCHNGQKRSDGMPTAFPANTRCLTCHKPPAAPANNTQP
jgi:c(7)-type cytochrome triheme protein